jgi:hypothetical protein
MIGVGPGFNIGINSSEKAIPFDADANAYFLRMAVDPGNTRKNLINTIVLDLKSNSLWTKIDILRLCASHTEQAALLNLKGDYWNGLKVSTPTFTTDKGWKGASGKSINSKFNPRLGGCVMTPGNASAIVYISTLIPTTASSIVTQSVNQIGGMWIYNNPSGGTQRGNWNTLTSTNFNCNIVPGIGFQYGRRNATDVWFNTHTQNYHWVTGFTTPFLNTEFYDASGYGSQQSLICYGSYLTDAEMITIRTIFTTYLTAIGVI